MHGERGGHAAGADGQEAGGPRRRVARGRPWDAGPSSSAGVVRFGSGRFGSERFGFEPVRRA
ncbi:hypothetical protein FTX61_02055 [Nitriliruptoraceae bacterium ZYF776]|nr:hypothetical protein [Profundirhabdus halotolerans]